MSKLYKCTLKCKIQGIPKKIEYLRSKSDNELITMFEQCENIEGSTYYGYKWVEIILIKIKDFPEILTLKVDS